MNIKCLKNTAKCNPIVHALMRNITNHAYEMGHIFILLLLPAVYNYGVQINLIGQIQDTSVIHESLLLTDECDDNRGKKDISDKDAKISLKMIIPCEDKDQYGNTVTIRNGLKTDAEGTPIEIWLDVPRIEFVLIPKGSFQMGSDYFMDWSYPEEYPKHEVIIANKFYMSKYEITQSQWQTVMGRNPAHFIHAGINAPVENVSWKECKLFCDKIGAFLPTEAQWEYACRAGSKSAIYSGSLRIIGAHNGPELDEIAWYGGNSGVEYANGFPSERWPEKQYNHVKAGTHPVGQKKPNDFGLYDMIGNVWEFCIDTRHDNYEGAPKNGEAWIGESSERVCRGGCWSSFAQSCRSASRNFINENNAGNIHFGLRPVIMIK